MGANEKRKVETWERDSADGGGQLATMGGGRRVVKNEVGMVGLMSLSWREMVSKGKGVEGERSGWEVYISISRLPQVGVPLDRARTKTASSTLKHRLPFGPRGIQGELDDITHVRGL
jgi:hypothetical protein